MAKKRAGGTRSRKPRAPHKRAPVKVDQRAQAQSVSPPPFIIVGVGASAGGFEAFIQILQGMPPAPDLSIIFVQHLGPQHGSSLPGLLSSHSNLPVVEVTEGVRIEPNRVYVVPPNVQMELRDGHLHLNPRPHDKTQYTPIDFFFRSLAKTLQERAIGVVLSGTGSDGADGIREIKAIGGITLAQDPSTARYDGMPRAAIATRLVDLVLPPKALAEKLAEIASNPVFATPVAQSTGLPLEEAPQITDEQLEHVLRLLLPAGGVDFMHYKSPTIIRRLLRRMALLKVPDIAGYIAHLEQNPDEAVNLHNDLLIHVTRFFREPDSFRALSAEVLPELLDNAHPDVPVRVWIAGCATGEEAYSLAMVLLEAIGDRETDTRVQIFGTDVSDAAIELARHGLYPSSIAGAVSAERLRRFFIKSDGGYRVTKALRDLCVFARQDLTRDPPFSRLDLICCRNVLIYMDSELQRRLLSVFHYALKPSGFLLLGHAETIGHNSELFTLMNKKHRIYRKKPTTAPAAEFPIISSKVKAELPGKAAPTDLRSGPRSMLIEANRIVLDRYAPPSVLIDQNFQVVHFNGQTGRFLEPSPGEPSFHVLKLVREGLLHGLRTALQTARKTRAPVRKHALPVRQGASTVDVDIEVIPLPYENQTYFLVLFEEHQEQTRKKSGRQPKVPKSTAPSHRVAKLEEELAATRDYLQSTIQEIEAANEELQSANEEILSSNEELQSTNEELDTAKEELQSTNEELNTVNDELHGRNDELTRANADLLNLLGSVQIAIVIVSSDLRIRRFTPMAEKILNLIPADVGRPISQISPNLVYPGLPALISHTIETMTPAEIEVRDQEGHWYLLRVRPYKGADSRIDGAVVALFDVDIAKRYSQRLEGALDQIEKVIDAVPGPMLVVDGEGRIRAANVAFSDTFGLPRTQLVQRLLKDVGSAEWNTPDIETLIKDQSGKESGEELRIERQLPGQGKQRFVVRAKALGRPEDKNARLVLLSFSRAE